MRREKGIKIKRDKRKNKSEVLKEKDATKRKRNKIERYEEKERKIKGRVRQKKRLK